jgi:type II secretory ATPase GspE/PulE/Tfp pilus assembly ATPase PilB-like protein
MHAIHVKPRRRGFKVRLRVSEPATVTLKVSKRGRKQVLTRVKKRAAGSGLTLTVRDRRLKRGRYTLKLVARDAAGNRSGARKVSVRLRR